MKSEEYGINFGPTLKYYIGIRKYETGNGLLILDGPRDSNINIRVELTKFELTSFLNNVKRFTD